MKQSLRAWTLCCICFVTAVAFGQTATTSLRGVVKDPSGALVPNASVQIVNISTGDTFHSVTDHAGFYIFPVVQPARYRITLTSSGFATQTRTAELLVAQPATIDFTLGIEANTASVDVSAATENLNFTDATIGNSVGNATIQALPMDERNPIALLTLQPGVLYLGPSEEDSRQGAVAGGRSDQGNVTVDGLDDNDQTQGTAFTGILRSTLDSTEEFRVTTSNGTAEAGRSSGAQVDLITKSGTNHFHGSLYEYYRPTNTVANSFFNKYSQLSQGEPNIPQKYIVNTFGGSVGGPIKRDKLFFFFNYEGERVGTDGVVAATVPTASFMAGELKYPDAASTPSNPITDTLTSAQVAQLDAPCASNTFDGQPVCPAGPGPNAAMLAYYAKVPVATGSILGDGYNSGSYYFISPEPQTLNTSIVKLDYTPNNKNHIFVRGNLQKDTSSGLENLPGQGPASYYDDNTKGLAGGYTWIARSNLVNDLRYGYIRQGYQNSGTAVGDYVAVYGLTQPQALTRDSIVHVPVNNITDTVTWVKGTHSIQVGGNWRGITNEGSSNGNSFNGAQTNPEYADDSDLPMPNMATNGLPTIASGFYTDYWPTAWADLMGIVPEVNYAFNYAITNATTATALPDGTPINRDFRSNEFEYFVQDTWHARSNLTITYGVRHTILQTPYETHGQEVAPTVDTDAWYKEREAMALKGQVYEPLLSYAPAGKANHAPGYWPKQKDNFAPRLGVVFAPDPKTSIRASFGIYFDHYGEALSSNFSSEGAPGLTTLTSNSADQLGFENSPRFTGPHNIPDIPVSSPVSPTISLPYVPNGADGFGISWGVDNHLKTPYSESFNFSIQHEFPKGFTFEQAYVGRLGRHLIQQLDLAEPVDYVDPQGSGDYFSNAAILSAEVDAAPQFVGGVKSATVQPIPYFEHVFHYMQNVDYQGESATQAIFNDAWAPQRYTNGETLALAILDVFSIFPGSPGTPGGAAQSTFWTDQFSSLYADATIGTSSYNALQFTLRHPPTHGLTLDFSYTFSKSLDLGSEAERASQEGNTDDAYTNFAIQNTWNPKLNKGPSDFDTHSLFTADWVYAFPVGHGRTYLAHDNGFVDALIGGWQFAGLARMTSGLPFSLESPAFPTNYNNPSMTFNVGNVQTHRNFVAGVPHEFSATTVNNVNNGIFYGQYIRLPYEGEAGTRNNFRGDGYFDIDSSLTKSWRLGDLAALKFAAEAYNITNTDRFDVSLAGLNARSQSVNLGTYNTNLSTYRRMQFGLRLDF